MVRAVEKAPLAAAMCMISPFIARTRNAPLQAQARLCSVRRRRRRGHAVRRGWGGQKDHEDARNMLTLACCRHCAATALDWAEEHAEASYMTQCHTSIAQRTQLVHLEPFALHQFAASCRSFACLSIDGSSSCRNWFCICR